MIKAAEPTRYLVPPHSASIWNVFFFFSLPSFGLFHPRPVVSAVTTSLLVTEVIRTCGSHARQIVSPVADKQG